MSPIPKTIDEYLATVADDQREALQKLREAIREAAPEAEECIAYQRPAFRQKRMLVGFGATKKHCSLYLMSTTVLDAFEGELARYDVSKGTLRFAPDEALPNVLVRKLVKARLAENAALDDRSSKTKSGKKVKKTSTPAPKFTPRQGQFLAFIDAYIRVNGVAPSENEICTRFALTPPSVHDAIVRMQERGLIDRTPRQARSIRILVPEDEIPRLEDKTTPRAPVRPLSRSQKETLWRTFVGKGPR